MTSPERRRPAGRPHERPFPGCGKRTGYGGNGHMADSQSDDDQASLRQPPDSADGPDDSPRLKSSYRKGTFPMVLAGVCALVVVAGVAAFSATINTPETAPAAISGQPRSTPAQERVALQANASTGQVTPTNPGRAT